MASPITTSTGAGYGLDITNIVKVLVNADTSAKANQIARQTSNNSAMISGIGSLRSALTAFQDAMKKLNDKDAPSFNAFAGTSANESVVKIKAGNTAVAGSYDVRVTQLATGSKVASAKFAGGADTPIPPGEMTISQNGKDYKINVPDGATLKSVRDQINKEVGAKGITANIINEAGGSRLVFGSTTTGKDSDISVSGLGLDIDGKQKMVGDGAGYINGLAQDAEFSIDGLELTSSKNTVDDAVSGLSLELTGVSDPKVTSGVKVTVALDNEGLKKSVQSFVDAYNTLQKAVSALTTPTKDENGKVTSLGPLSNDPTTKALLGDLRKVIADTAGNGNLNTLSQLGINTQKDGTLEFNGTKFSAALNDKKLGAEIQGLFTGDQGVFTRMNKAIDPYNASGGTLDSRKSNLDQAAKNLANQKDALDNRIELLTVSLTKKFSALDAALAKMQKQGEQITSIFEAMNAQAKKS
ncbi:flagellar filament capping protein FliD [Pseudomonas sp. CCOS 191]|uniref:flagellar filament capping protein FliD n=1 Tax=Pseudomonas sp. CCOS 191 TaxID=1649877 RepID=UPI0006247120|nr:flagellar filament capping protein FliD [Pseudomonas sp. CCOS 191]CRI56028.1 flagellar hook protein FliD [Pseudomonas sp. CCOS 191]